MPRGSYTNHHWICDESTDKVVAALKERKDIEPDKLAKMIVRVQKHKKHYNGTIRISKNTDRKEFKRNRYCPVLRQKTKNALSSVIKHSS